MHVLHTNIWMFSFFCCYCCQHCKFSMANYPKRWSAFTEFVLMYVWNYFRANEHKWYTQRSIRHPSVTYGPRIRRARKRNDIFFGNTAHSHRFWFEFACESYVLYLNYHFVPSCVTRVWFECIGCADKAMNPKNGRQSHTVPFHNLFWNWTIENYQCIFVISFVTTFSTWRELPHIETQPIRTASSLRTQKFHAFPLR